MELGWSDQSTHIRTLYAPWQPGDGYEESVIAAAEKKLEISLPASLRILYRAWGKRSDITETNQFLLSPDRLVRLPDALVFCAENQNGCYWAIPDQALGETDPPVLIAEVMPLPIWSIYKP